MKAFYSNYFVIIGVDTQQKTLIKTINELKKLLEAVDNISEKDSVSWYLIKYRNNFILITYNSYDSKYQPYILF